jgi:hypothetical protein
VIFADPKMPLRDKELVIRAFAEAIGDLMDYIPGPDIGMDDLGMVGWIRTRPAMSSACRAKSAASSSTRS